MLNNLEDASDFAEDLSAEYERDTSIDMGAVEEELESLLADPDVSTDLPVPAPNFPTVPAADKFPVPPSHNQQSQSAESERSQLLAHMELH